MRKIIFGILAIGLIGFYFYTNPSSNNEWLYGKWEIKDVIDKSIFTNMTFRKDGSMTLGNKKGAVYNDCTYELYTRRVIDFVCIISGKKGVFSLNVDYDKTEISFPDSNTFIKKQI